MKNTGLTVILTLLAQITMAQNNFLDNYINGNFNITVIGDSTDQVNRPRDLDFKHKSNELWVVNYGDGSGGTTVTFYNTGTAEQTSQYRRDTHAGHFLIYPSAIAFSDEGKWASTQEVRSTSGNSTFMGPTLWSADTAVYARVFQSNWGAGLPLGSHLDMLHQSPFAMGVAHDSAMAYWVMDGHNGNICKYDFVEHHGPGYEDHSNGIIWRYTDVTVSRVNGIPSHMVLDKESGWLYFIDGGSKTIKRLNTNSGAITGNLTPPSSAPEVLDDYFKVEGAIVEVLDTLQTQPCGIDFYNNRLIVSDNTTGDIYLYNTVGTPTLLGTIATGAAGIMGIKVGFDGRIYYVNNQLNTVNRIDINPPSSDAYLREIILPSLNNHLPEYYSTLFNFCEENVTPAIKVINTGTGPITELSFSYSIDNGPATVSTASVNLNPGDTLLLNLPSAFLSEGPHLFNVTINQVNGAPDMISNNNSLEGSFRVIPVGTLPYIQEFNTPAFPPSGWNAIGYNPNNKLSYSTAGSATPGSIKMDNYSGVENTTGQVDYFMSPRFDFTGVTAPELSFYVAHARGDNTTNDRLNVLVSTDCGTSWQMVYNRSGAALATAPAVTSIPFTPSPTQWRRDSIDLTAFSGQSDVIFMFQFESNFGNNVYIDGIIVSDIITSVNDLSERKATLYPNPVAGNSITISGTFSTAEPYQITDQIGNVVARGILNEKTIDISNLAKGTYFLHFEESRPLKLVRL